MYFPSVIRLTWTIVLQTTWSKGKVVPGVGHAEMWGSGGIAPRILNLGTRWRWVVSSGHLPPKKEPPSLPTRSIGGWDCPRAGLDVVAKRKTLPSWESNPGRFINYVKCGTPIGRLTVWVAHRGPWDARDGMHVCLKKAVTNQTHCAFSWHRPRLNFSE
jgi:hypothetical protein